MTNSRKLSMLNIEMSHIKLIRNLAYLAVYLLNFMIAIFLIYRDAPHFYTFLLN